MYTYTYIRHRAFLRCGVHGCSSPVFCVLCIVVCVFVLCTVFPVSWAFSRITKGGGSQDKIILKMKNAKFQIVLKMQKIGEVVTTSYIDPKGPPWSHVPFLP